MAIRWDEFPHQRIRLEIYARLGRNDVARSSEDSLRHILLRRLPSLRTEDHQRYIELEARSLVEHLRSTRDAYREFVESQGCRPVLEAQWVVLCFAVLPTAISILRQRVIDYAKLTRVLGRDLSLLFGVVSRSCYRDSGEGIALLGMPDLEDKTPATDEELGSLGRCVDGDGLLIFEDIREEGGAVFRLHGGGPFSVDDYRSILTSFELAGLRIGVNVPEWIEMRERLWHLRAPWTEGLCDLFTSVQEELMSQWRALPPDSLVHEFKLSQQASEFRSIVVPARERTPAEEAVRESLNAPSNPRKRKPGRRPRVPVEFVVCAGALWRKAISSAGNNVPDVQLREIAVALDEAGHFPPAEYLEGKCAQEIKYFNSRNSNSKVGPVLTWSELVSRGDKDHVRGMRKLLSRCSRRHLLSGN